MFVFALVAQGIEQEPSKLLVGGSNPPERATKSSLQSTFIAIIS